MSATKIIWHQVVLVCLVVLAFLWAATEWTAGRLAFQPQLGSSTSGTGQSTSRQPSSSGGSLYLVVPPPDIVRTKSLMRLILNQIGRRLTESLDPDRRRQKLLLMLDEFAALGRLDFLESQLAFMAGYGTRSSLMTQSLNQLERAYGPNHAILDNYHVRIAFSTNDERTAKRVSDAVETATELRATKNFARHRLSPWLGHLMVSPGNLAAPAKSWRSHATLA
ncbi:type IV secretory pathway TraG/TraD family ATPase VirD4 [Bradyrhizobium niftali]